MIVLMLLSSYIIFSSSFTELEEQYALHNTHMLTDTIQDDMSSLSSSASYMALYAEFDNMDTDSGKGYDKIFQDEELLNNHDIDNLLIYDPSSELLLFNSEAFDEGNDVTSVNGIKAYIASHPEILPRCQEEVCLSGLIFLPDRTLVVAMNSFASGGISEQDTSIVVASRLLDLKGMSAMQEGSGFAVHLENASIYPNDKEESMTGQFAGNVFLSS
ncbi:hypothetical protein V7O67_01280 [Methanolobus sp. ZRKC4]